MTKRLSHSRRPPPFAPTLCLLAALVGVLVTGCAGSAPPAPATLPAASVDAARKSVEYLAGADLEGRGLGTAGLDAAAQYIAGYFKGLGLNPPPGQSDYFQPFTYTTLDGIAPETSLVVNGTELRPTVDYQPQAISAEKSISAPVAFVGYGVAAKKDKDGNDINYDDYAGIDVSGKIALALRFEPTDDKGKSRLDKQGFSAAAGIAQKAELAASKGAVALLYVHPPDRHGPDMLSPLSRRGAEATAAIPVTQVKQRVAEDLLRAAGAQGLKSYQLAIDTDFAPRSFLLRNSKVEGKVALKRNVYHLRNVSAVLPGKGKLADQYIVVGAHYDHLGRGGFGSLARNSNAVHHGADDNASGTAALLETARILKTAGPLRRSVIFIAFSGEELGLLGSRHWVKEPPVPIRQVAAMLNMDMVGRVRNNRLIIGGAGTAAPFDLMLQRLDAGSPLEFQIQGAWRDGRAPSDITSFVTQKIPGIMFFSGVHADYHRPTDTAEKVNHQSLGHVIDAAARLVVEIDQMSPESLAFTTPAPAPATRPTTSPGPLMFPTTQTNGDPHLKPGGASLGVQPEYGADPPAGGGIVLAGASPGSAAERAGILPGDVLTHFDGQKLHSIEDLMHALNRAVPNKSITIRVTRNGQPLDLEATPTERRPIRTSE